MPPGPHPPRPDEPSSGELNSVAFEVGVRAYGPELLGRLNRLMGNREAAEDVLQRALLKAWECRSRFKGGDLRAWLFSFVNNTLANWLRGRRRADRLSAALLVEVPRALEPPEIDPLAQRTLGDCIAALKPLDQTIICLAFGLPLEVCTPEIWKGLAPEDPQPRIMTDPEIAAWLIAHSERRHTPESVRKRRVRAQEQLAECMTAKGAGAVVPTRDLDAALLRLAWDAMAPEDIQYLPLSQETSFWLSTLHEEPLPEGRIERALNAYLIQFFQEIDLQRDAPTLSAVPRLRPAPRFRDYEAMLLMVAGLLVWMCWDTYLSDPALTTPGGAAPSTLRGRPGESAQSAVVLVLELGARVVELAPQALPSGELQADVPEEARVGLRVQLPPSLGPTAPTEISYWRRDGDGGPGTLLAGPIPLIRDAGGSAASTDFGVSLAALDLEAGERLELRVRLGDASLSVLLSPRVDGEGASPAEQEGP